MKLGFFDSGLGGLFVMESFRKEFSNYDYVYLGDTKNLPYGPRDTQELLGLMTPCLIHLLEQERCDHVIVACNTISVKALPLFLKKNPTYKGRVHGISDPTQELLVNLNLEKLLVLATHRTVRSGVYASSRSIQVEQVAMPGLVDLIEDQDIKGALAMCDDALAYYPRIKNVLLGCTHYLLLKEELQQKYPQINFIGQDKIIVDYLARKGLRAKGTIDPPEYLVTYNSTAYQMRYGFDFKLREFRLNK